MAKNSPLRVLFVASECAPWVKTGGLGDVIAALPPALRALGIDVRVCLPLYGFLPRVAREAPICGTVWGSLIRETVLPSGVPVYLIDAPGLFDREGGPYQDKSGQDWSDNAERFGLLSRVAATLASGESPLAWRPQILHAHDWQAGLAPAWLRSGLPGPAASVMTVHNLAFQGIFPADALSRIHLPGHLYAIEGVEFYGQLSFLKGGLHYADVLTTVSPTYAREIQEPEQGCGLQGLLVRRREDLVGIINGIDDVVWNPETDPYLAATYSKDDLSGKGVNKEAIQRRCGLNVDPERPLFGLVSRLTWQKGVDLVLEVADELMAKGAQLVVLGSGEPALEAAVSELGARHPGAVGTHIGFDEGLAHMIEAGADAFLMPSRFEPCGLNQMYSQRYGTVPLVRATGGLADTVRNAGVGESRATGFVFQEAVRVGLWGALSQALACYRDKTSWTSLIRNGMEQNFAWIESAARYREVYDRALRVR